MDENPYETLEIDFDIAEHDPLRDAKIALLQKLNLQYVHLQYTLCFTNLILPFIRLSNKLGMGQLSPFMVHTLRISNNQPTFFLNIKLPSIKL